MFPDEEQERLRGCRMKGIQIKDERKQKQMLKN
jgi:hypothetical protein